MAVFTPVSHAELSNWLHDYPLGSLLDLQGIASGIENTNYFVTTEQGRCVLTLFEKLTARELPFYLNLMAHLARHGVPCPAPVANRHGEFLGEIKGKPACLVSRLSGKSTLSPSLAQCHAVGAMLAKLHLAGQQFAEVMPNARGAEWRIATAPLVAPFLDTEQTKLLNQEIALHAPPFSAALPRGIIHADLFRDNVLLEGSQVGGLIDFYFACTDVLLYDVAITVNDWCLNHANGQLDVARTQAFLRAYHAVRPLQDCEQSAWSSMLRLAALRFWLSRLFDLHMPREGEMIQPHDPTHFERVLRHHIATRQSIWL